MGMVTPAGSGTEPLWTLVREQKSYFDKGLGFLSQNRVETLAESISLQSIEAAMKQAGWTSLRPDDGVILATTTGEALTWEKGMVSFIRREISGDKFFPDFQLLPLGSLLTSLSQKIGFQGRTQLLTTACAAGVHAVATASHWIRTGRVKRCLVGGVEALCSLTVQGFKSLQLLSEQPCRPFDTGRTGINLSEGAAFLCLESDPRHTPLAEIRGGGFSLDAYHMTSPDPEGKGSQRALRQALAQAGISAREVDWVHAHGTGSLHNDIAESIAIATIFREAGLNTPPVTSTKGTHGHFLGATGVIETALVVESLLRQEILPTTNFQSAGDKIEIPVVRNAKKTELRHVLKNVLGFSGSNGALVVSK